MLVNLTWEWGKRNYNTVVTIREEVEDAVEAPSRGPIPVPWWGGAWERKSFL